MHSTESLGKLRPVAAPRLYLVTPDRSLAEIVEPVAAVIEAVDVIVQVRCKSLPDQEFRELAQHITSLCHAAGRLCIVNDRLDIAVDVGADGVHLGQSDLAVTEARQHFDGIIGHTCRTIDDAHAAVAAGADYIGAGPTFASSTKPELSEPLGISGVSSIAGSVTIPTYAIGGITASSATELRQAGVYGVAVVSAIFDQPNSAVPQAQRLADALLANTDRTGTNG